MARQPKDIEFHAVYEPDMSRMVKALQILLDWKPAKKEKEINRRDNDVKRLQGVR